MVDVVVVVVVVVAYTVTQKRNSPFSLAINLYVLKYLLVHTYSNGLGTK